MEAILPVEMIGEILKYLSNLELAMYGQSSKTTLMSSEMEWKVRYNRLCRDKNVLKKILDVPKISEDKEFNEFFECKPTCNLVFWMNKYTVNIRIWFRAILLDKMESFENESNKSVKKSIISEMFDFMLANRYILFGNLRFSKFTLSVEKKLEELLNGNETEFLIAEKYYPLLYPRSYEMALTKKKKAELEQERLLQLELEEVSSESNSEDDHSEHSGSEDDAENDDEIGEEESVSESSAEENDSGSEDEEQDEESDSEEINGNFSISLNG
jgi:hypothetical protein